MTLLLVGVSERAIGLVRAAATPLAIDVRVGDSSDPPDWVMTATGDERAEAIRRHTLPGYRVIHIPQLADAAGPPEAIVRDTVSRMAEVGAVGRSTRVRAARFALHTIPLVTEWATWLAADEARQTIAEHRTFLRSKHGTDLKGRVLLVVPDVHVFSALGGLLSKLADERHRVNVVVTHPPVDDPDVSSWHDRHWGLTVGGLSELQRSPWRPLARAIREGLAARRRLASPVRALATRALVSLERALPLELAIIAVLDEFKPDVAVVVPHRSVDSIETDLVRVARWLGVPSLLLPLRWDDLESDGALTFDAPDVVAVWNDTQRSGIAGRHWVQPRRVEVTGALLPSDVIGVAPPVDRAEYCAKLEIEPSRRIILFEAPVVSTRASMDRFQEWRRRIKDSADPDVRRASVVVYVDSPDEVAIWRRLEATDGISVARAGTDERRVPFRLNDALMTADVVMSATVPVTLEALARARPVVVLLDGHDDSQGELARFCGAHAPSNGWPQVARGVEDAVGMVSTLLGSQVSPERSARIAASVRVASGEGGTLRVYALLNDLARGTSTGPACTRPPAWRRLLVLWLAARARRRDGQVSVAKTAGTAARTDRNAGTGSG